MRLAPVPMMFWQDVERAGAESALSSETTHVNSLCKDICKLFGKMVARAIQGVSKEEILGTDRTSTEYDALLVPILEQAYRSKRRDEIQSSGWVLHTIETVLWAFASTETFEDGLVLVINLAGDADTNGAIYGMLAGAHYGYDAIPPRWLNSLQRPDMIERVYLLFIEKVINC
jgi:ADP-ribosyl-[dinitrogen reductase] hydrolase